MAARLGGRLLVLVSSCPVKGEVQASGGARSTVPDHLLSSAVGIDRDDLAFHERFALHHRTLLVFGCSRLRVRRAGAGCPTLGARRNPADLSPVAKFLPADRTGGSRRATDACRNPE